MPKKYLESEFQLQSNSDFATVSAYGATLTELVIGNTPIIQHATKEDVDLSFAGATLAPWPNRLAGASWNYRGSSLSWLENDGQGNANHGLVFNRVFDVKEKTSNRAVFEYIFGHDLVYPFQVNFQVSYELTETGLVTSLYAKNIGSEAAPIAFGSHPYIKVDSDSRVLISGNTQSVNNSFQIPVGTEPATKQRGNGIFNETGARFSDLVLDDCFMDLDRDAEGIARVEISQPSGNQITLWQDRKFKYLMAYTHPTLGIALEPMTAPANALNSGTDLVWLESGESITANWGVRVAL